MTASISTVDAKEKLADLVNRVHQDKERIILTRRGKEVAAIVPLEDLQALQETQNKADLQDAQEALGEARKMGTLSLEDLKRERGFQP